METPAYATKSGGELVLPEALEDLMDLEDQDAGGMKSNVKDKSMDLDIYHDLYDIEPAGSKKPDQMDRSLELDIYDDLDDFQKAEDRVSCARRRPSSGVRLTIYHLTEYQGAAGMGSQIRKGTGRN